MISNQPRLPDTWTWTTLGEVSNTLRKKVNPRTYPDLPYIGLENVESHSMRLLGTQSAKNIKSNAESFSPGDVLYGRLRPYLNKVFSPSFHGLCSAEFIPFRKTINIETKYLQYFLNSWEFVQFATRLNAGDRPRVDFSQLANFPFPLAPLSDQKRIVTKIEELFSQLDAAEAALKRAKANLKRYRQSVLQAAVTGELTRAWREAHASEIEPAGALLERIRAERRAKWEAELRAKGKDPAKEKYVEPQGPDTKDLPELPEGWVWTNINQIALHRLGKMLDKEKNKGTLRPYLRNANVRWFSFDLESVFQIRVTDEELSDVSVEKGDLVVCEGGEPGRAAVWKKDNERIVIQKALHRLRFGKSISPYWVAFSLASDASSGRLEPYFTGSTIKHFTGESLLSYQLPIPSLMEQEMIVSEIEKYFSLIFTMERSIDSNQFRISRFRQSILQRAFSGQLLPDKDE